MCRRCWAMVPAERQRDVYAAWNDGKRTAAWNRAVAAAVAAVASQGDLFAAVRA